jgi:hypothetical protein
LRKKKSEFRIQNSEGSMGSTSFLRLRILNSGF